MTRIAPSKARTAGRVEGRAVAAAALALVLALGTGVRAQSPNIDFNSWVQRTNFPVLTSQNDVVEHNGTVYVLGGWNGAALDGVQFSRVLADGSLQGWTATTSLPETDQGPGVTVSGNYIYVAFGSGAIRSAPINADGTLAAWRAEPNPAGGWAWGRQELEAYQGRLYKLGGWNGGSGFHDGVYLSDLDGNGNVTGWTATTPLPKGLQHMSFHFYNGRAYVAGGITNGLVISDSVYSAPVNANGTIGAWRSEANLPATRWQHSSVLIDGVIYVLGGRTAYSSGFTTQIHRGTIDPLSGAIASWTLVGNLPSNFSQCPGVVFVPGSRTLLLVGGFDGGGPKTDGVWSLSDPMWVQKFPSTSPAARRFSALAWDGSRVILFGGSQGATLFNDLWWYDPVSNTWTEKIAQGSPGSPPARHAPGMVWDGARVILFAGSSSGGARNDLWWYDPGTNSWTEKITDSTPGSPGARDQFGMVWNGSDVVIFGGWTPGLVHMNDTWWYNPGTNSWTEKITHGSPGSPSGRANFGMTWDGSRIILFGGNFFPPTYYNDVWWYDPGTNTWTEKITDATPGSPPQRTEQPLVWNGSAAILFGGVLTSNASRNDTWSYDPASNSWTERIPNGTAGSPPVRRAHYAMTWAGTRVILFGGNGGSDLNDTWWYTGADATPPTAGTVRDGTGADIDTQSSLTTISANWPSIQDPESQIVEYEWAIGTTPGGTEIQPFISVGIATSATNANLHLERTPTQNVGAGAWTVVGNMSTPRWGHTCTVLNSGKVLIAGGTPDASGSYWTLASTTCEVFDPATNSFTPVASMNTARFLHAAALLPDGKVLVAGGQSTANGYMNSCEIYDPVANTWTPTGNLTEASSNHFIVLLNNGKILLAGASGAGFGSATCQLFDPAAGTWANTGSLNTSGHQGGGWDLLVDGKVLIAGGYNWSSVVEVYDPVAGTWSNVGNLQQARASLGAARLPDGTVRILGGTNNGTIYALNDLYTPGVGVAASGATLSTGRANFGTVRTSDGKIVAISGQVTGGGSTTSCEIFDPVGGAWTAGPSMNVGRVFNPPNGTTPVQTLGQLYVFGGYSSDGVTNTVQSSAEVVGEDPTYYVTVRATNGAGLVTTATSDGVRIDVAAPAAPVVSSPTTGTITTDTTPTLTGTAEANATVSISDGATLIGTVVASSSGAWTFTAPAMTEGTHTLTARATDEAGNTGANSTGVTVTVETSPPVAGTVNDGTGADIDVQTSTTTISANWSGFTDAGSGISGYDWAIGTTSGGTDVQAFTAVGTATSASNSNLALGILLTGSWTVVGSMTTPRWAHTVTVLNSGKVLITGGCPIVTSGHPATAMASCEVFDPANNSFTAVASMNTSRFRHGAVLLPDGKVLVAGGTSTANGSLNTCEIYDPVANTWTATGNLTQASSNHFLVLLNTGKILLGGASGSGFGSAVCQLYDPAAGTWSNTGSLGTSGHQFGGWSVLNDGKVLVAGGYSWSSAVEVYDPLAGIWANVGSMQQARSSLGAATLLDGTVRIFGGVLNGTKFASNEVHTPGGGVAASGAQFLTARSHFGTIRTGDGKILVISGQGGAATTTSCEVFDPAVGTWASGPALNSSRTFEPAFGQPVRVGGRIYVFGNYDSNGTVHSSAESLSEATTYYVTVRATNGVGMTANATSDGVRIGSAAAAPVITSPSTGAVTGAAPTVTGTAPAGATVTVLDGSTSLGTAVADGFGAWTFVVPALSEGAHTLTARVGAGPDSAGVAIVVDTTVPSITTTSLTSGTIGSIYRQTLAATDATATTWALISGALPTGLSLGTDGVITGTPTAAGTFAFTVRAFDAAGNTADQALSIDVSSPSAPSVQVPSAGPGAGTAPLSVTFTGAATTGAPIVSVVWNFGDGSTFTTDSVTGVQHVYEIAGTYTVTLTVTDNLGQSGFQTTTVVVTAPATAPTVSVATDTTSGAAPLAVAFTGTATTSTGAFIGYEWDFDGDGVIDFSSPDSAAANHVYTEAGTFTAYFKAIRSDGTAAAATVQVVVGVPAGTAPVVAAGPTAGTNPVGVGVPVTFSATGTAGAGASGTRILYSWDFDGDGAPDLVEENGTSGTASTPTFAYEIPGTYVVTVAILDFQADGSPRLSAEGTVTVTVNPPTGIRVFIAQPRDGRTISGNHVTANLNAVPASQIDFATAALQFRLTGTVAFTTASTTNEGSAPPSARLAWDLSTTGDNLAAGFYELRATVRDTLGTLYASDDPGQQGVVTVEVVASGDDSETRDADGRVRRDHRFDRGGVTHTMKSGRQDYEVTILPIGIDVASGTVTIEELAANPEALPTNLFDLTHHEVGIPAGSRLLLPATVEVTYEDADGNGVVDGTSVRTDGLRILHFNAARGAWDTLPGQTHDTVGRRVIGRTFSLSPVVLSGPSSSSSRSGGGGGGICFLAPILPAPLWPFAAGFAALGLVLTRRRR